MGSDGRRCKHFMKAYYWCDSKTSHPWSEGSSRIDVGWVVLGECFVVGKGAEFIGWPKANEPKGRRFPDIYRYTIPKHTSRGWGFAPKIDPKAGLQNQYAKGSPLVRGYSHALVTWATSKNQIWLLKLIYTNRIRYFRIMNIHSKPSTSIN